MMPTKYEKYLIVGVFFSGFPILSIVIFIGAAITTIRNEIYTIYFG